MYGGRGNFMELVESCIFVVLSGLSAGVSEKDISEELGLSLDVVHKIKLDFFDKDKESS